MNRYHTAYGFDLEKSLAKHPIKGLADADQKATVMRSLEKGNLHAVTFQRDGKEEKMFLEANSKDRNVIVYDSSMKKQFQGIRAHKREVTGMKEGNTQEASSRKRNDGKIDTEDEFGVKKKEKRKGVST